MYRIPALIIGCVCALPVSATANPVPAYILQLPASVESVLIAETDTSTLYRFVPGEAGLDAVEQRYISIGENGVGKQRAWDRRTPLGIYFISDQLDTSRMHEKYGPSAFPLDYPNAWDRRNRRSGDGIWIHGVTPGGGQRPPRDTDGCIALPNDALRTLEPHLKPWRTPVIVTRSLQNTDADELRSLRRELNDLLQVWVLSLKAGDWHRYFALYDPTFSYHGLSRDEWISYRLRSAAGRPLQALTVDEVLLLADPDHKGLYLSRFVQTLVENERRVVVQKRLYWQRTAAGKLRIVAEDNG